MGRAYSPQIIGIPFNLGRCPISANLTGIKRYSPILAPEGPERVAGGKRRGRLKGRPWSAAPGDGHPIGWEPWEGDRTR
jgi:hypothetical protein